MVIASNITDTSVQQTVTSQLVELFDTQETLKRLRVLEEKVAKLEAQIQKK